MTIDKLKEEFSAAHRSLLQATDAEAGREWGRRAAPIIDKFYKRFQAPQILMWKQ